MSYPVKIILFLVSLFTIGSIADYLFEMQLRSKLSYEFEKMDECVNGSTPFDAVFFGDSRIQYGLNPFYFDSITGLNSYNIGEGGAQLDEIFLLNLIYLQKHPPPSIVIVGLDEDKIFKGHRVLPYRTTYLFYTTNDSMRYYLSKNGFYANLVNWIPFTRYAFFDDYYRTMIFKRKTPLPKSRHNPYKGFINPHLTIREDSLIISKTPKNTPDNAVEPPVKMIEILRAIFKLYEKTDTRIILLTTPSHISIMRDQAQIIAIKKLSSDFKNVSVLDLQKIDSLSDAHFQDPIHLNEPGTKIFTQHVAERVMEIR